MDNIASVMLLGSILVAMLIGAVTLWGACRVYNRLARSDGQLVIPEPTPRKALGITALLMLLDWGVKIVLELFAGSLHGDSRSSQILVHLVAAAFGFLMSAVLVSLLLPTTARRAILVVLLQIAMEILIVVALLGVAIAVSSCAASR